jgi:hypothetical protein
VDRRELERNLKSILKCCKENNCSIQIIEGQIVTIQSTLDDHETRITILEGSSSQTITVVNNYSALPDPTTVPNQFYYTENSQGTRWLPGSLGGTYYPGGTIYYSNGVSWVVAEVPWQATQSDVNAGTVTDEFVSPYTLANYNKWEKVSTKSVNVASPTGSENITLFFTEGQITIVEIYDVIRGLGASVDWNISFGTDRSVATFDLFNTDRTTVSIIGSSTTIFDNPVIPANNWVWLTTSSISGTIEDFNITIRFT